MGTSSSKLKKYVFCFGNCSDLSMFNWIVLVTSKIWEILNLQPRIRFFLFSQWVRTIYEKKYYSYVILSSFYVKSRKDLTAVLPGLTYDGIPRSYLRYSTILPPLFVVKLNKLLAAGNHATAKVLFTHRYTW